MKNSPPGLRKKFWRAFVLQILLISITVVLGIYASRYVLGDILLERALIDEANHFWNSYQEDRAFSRPDTRNLTGYLEGMDEIPDFMQQLEPGLHQLPRTGSEFYIVHVSERHDRKLYLEFDGENVGKLALLFGVIPLSILLIVIYISSWVLYKFSQRAISPVIRLAQKVKRFDPKPAEEHSFANDGDIGEADQEVLVLANALDELLARINRFVERERNFTRDASHELRSPITVIKIAVDMIEMDTSLSDSARLNLERIKRSARDMEGLIEALLLLARESEDQLATGPVCLNDLIDEEIDRARIIYNKKDIEFKKLEDIRLVVNASDRVLSVMIGNLLRNACSYTESGMITVTIGGSMIEIEDTGTGIHEDQVQDVFKPFKRGNSNARGGHGVGLTIVKMLSQRFNWPVHIESQPGVGTRVRVSFPVSENAPLS
ncbi:MAG: HAMP domain-containing sensor histidine kinase [Gammaproteobacteria bacterium]|nr:HAMP domain-containing sensor histidine kinase [Gammaproteobacteria bacterium]